MDDEARALAQRTASGMDNSKATRKKLKRQLAAAVACDPEMEHVKEQYEAFCRDLRHKFFPGQPTLEDIGDNNRMLRQHVASRMEAVEKAQLRICDKLHAIGGNSSNEVVIHSGTIFPPCSTYIQRYRYNN
jgi:hypothetical protein